ATGKGNDQVRFELTAFALEPDIQIIAPWRTWDFDSRQALIEYAAKHDIPIPVTAEKPYSMDRNLLHISFEGGILEDPWNEPPKDMFVLTVDPQDAPDEPAYIEVQYEQGNPVAVDGVPMGPVKIFEHLNEIGGANGIGRVDMVENRYVGIKSRGVYETPGGTILQAAHRAIESITMDRDVMHLRDGLVPRYAEMIYQGYWYAPEREMLQVAIDESQKNVTGTARLKLYKGNVITVGRKSPVSLYDPEIATFESDTVYDQADATGFIRLNALRLRVRARVNAKK
ncbi:argininosuccinate synthase, partial [bacterium]|nr:argininosuccinate synthase [bacterium]